MDIEEFRLILNEVLSGFGNIEFQRDKDSFFIKQHNFIIGSVRVTDKYSSLNKEVSYWLCAGHNFVRIEGKREKEAWENRLAYPFRIPWKSAKKTKIKKLDYDPMNWDSRRYDPIVIYYGKESERKIKKKLIMITKTLISLASNLEDLSASKALAIIEAKNGDVWIGKEYIRSYQNFLDNNPQQDDLGNADKPHS